MKYVAVGPTITNRIIFEDGRIISDIMGGDVFYLSGIRLGTKDCIYVSYVGGDFEDFYGEWFDANDLSRDGLIFKLNKTNYNELVYLGQGRYKEYSIYTQDYDPLGIGFSAIPTKCLAEYIKDDTKGLCIGTRMTKPYHDDMVELKEKFPNLMVMWEYYPYFDDNGVMQKAEEFFKFKDAFDILSINHHECRELFDIDDEAEIIEELKKIGKPVYFRVGKRGAYFIDKGEHCFAPSIHLKPAEEEVDPTGCGNTSTAAAMWAYCEGYDALNTCIWGNLAAAHNVLQYGPYPHFTEETKHNAIKKMSEIAENLKG